MCGPLAHPEQWPPQPTSLTHFLFLSHSLKRLHFSQPPQNGCLLNISGQLFLSKKSDRQNAKQTWLLYNEKIHACKNLVEKLTHSCVVRVATPHKKPPDCNSVGLVGVLCFLTHWPISPEAPHTLVHWGETGRGPISLLASANYRGKR